MADKKGVQMYSSYKSLSQAVDKVGCHDHLCLIYETQEEQFAAVVPFIRIGLERGEKCVYIADDNTSARVIEAMSAGGIDTDGAIKAGALSVLTKQEAYLREGYFDPDRMIDFLKEATAAAKADGYSALRVTGEMTWMLGGDPGSERLIEYESKLNYFFPEYDALAICQYNFMRFKPEIIIGVIRTHPFVIYRGQVCRNFYYVPPDEMLLPNQPYLEVDRLLYNILERGNLEDLRMEANENLQKMDMELKEIERVGKVGSWAWDAATDVITWSYGMYRVFGLDPLRPPATYKEHLRLYTPESAERLAKVVELTLQTGGFYELDLELMRKDGSKRWIMARGEARRDGNGKVIGLYGAAVDITERKLAEEELRKLNTELQDALGKVGLLHKMLPICASCKRIRNEQGAWEGLEHYLKGHYGTEFTHGTCPECADAQWDKLKKTG